MWGRPVDAFRDGMDAIGAASDWHVVLCMYGLCLDVRVHTGTSVCTRRAGMCRRVQAMHGRMFALRGPMGWSGSAIRGLRLGLPPAGGGCHPLISASLTLFGLTAAGCQCQPTAAQPSCQQGLASCSRGAMSEVHVRDMMCVHAMAGTWHGMPALQPACLRCLCFSAGLSRFLLLCDMLCDKSG